MLLPEMLLTQLTHHTRDQSWHTCKYPLLLVMATHRYSHSQRAKVPSATQSSVTGLQWFKVWEDGLTSDGKWGVDRLIANKGKVTFTIPSCIAAGQYLLRVEIIGMHL